MPRLGSVLLPFVVACCLIGGWEVVDRVCGIQKIILPAPSEIVGAIHHNYPRLFQETGITMLEAILGFLLGGAIAYGLALAFVLFPLVRDALYPYAIALKSTPLIAIAPILVLWFGNGIESKVVMSALVAFFPVLVNSVDGLTSIDPAILDLCRSLSASRWQILRKVRIPHSAPHLFSSLKIASSLAVVGAVIGEFTGSQAGIGHLINTSSYYLDTDLTFAGIFFISVAGILFFSITVYLEHRVVFWVRPR